MSGHVRALSASLGDKVHDAAHAITDAGQDAVDASTTAIQRIVHRDEAPEWSTFYVFPFLLSLQIALDASDMCSLTPFVRGGRSESRPVHQTWLPTPA